MYSFGGLAIGSSALNNRWQRIAVYLTGPAAGFLLYGLVLLLQSSGDMKQTTPLLRGVLFQLEFINLWWGLLNLLPIWPLDGGQVSRDFLGWLIPGQGVRASLGISIVVAGLLAVNSFLVSQGMTLLPYLEFGSVYLAIFFAIMAFNSFQLLQAEANRPPWDPNDYRQF
jgi:Zn-dependent protease